MKNSNFLLSVLLITTHCFVGLKASDQGKIIAFTQSGHPVIRWNSTTEPKITFHANAQNGVSLVEVVCSQEAIEYETFLAVTKNSIANNPEFRANYIADASNPEINEHSISADRLTKIFDAWTSEGGEKILAEDFSLGNEQEVKTIRFTAIMYAKYAYKKDALKKKQINDFLQGEEVIGLGAVVSTVSTGGISINEAVINPRTQVNHLYREVVYKCYDLASFLEPEMIEKIKSENDLLFDKNNKPFVLLGCEISLEHFPLMFEDMKRISNHPRYAVPSA